MTTLRVLVSGAPDPSGEWALFDDAGACMRTGRGLPSGWPAADRVEAVLPASQARIATVTLPPLSSPRVAAAARFAVEDQLAGAPDAHHLAVSAQQPDGRVRVVVVARSVVAALRERIPRVARVVAEPDLASPRDGWRWCGGAGGGFVRRADGSAFPLAVPAVAAALPAELALALAQCRRDGAPPREVHVDAEIDADSLARWRKETGVPFVRGTAWRWHAASPTAFAGAVDLLQGDFALVTAAAPGSRRRLFVPALVFAGAALALNVVATVGEWGSLRIAGLRQAREWTALAATAGLAPDTAAAPSSARVALIRRYSELRHANGLPAPDDALPLLARAAPAFGALPPGTVKSASYADGHWTVDLARADAAQVGELDARLREAGVPALLATSAAGARVRVGAP